MEKRFRQISSYDDSQGKVSGYALLWNTPAKVSSLGGRLESFDKDSVKFADTVLLHCQHNENLVLGNSRAGTLKLSKDQKGLFFEAVLPKSATATREALSRKDLDGCSIGFKCLEDDLSGNTRKIKRCLIKEISLVADPVHKTELNYRNKTKALQKKFQWTDFL